MGPRNSVLRCKINFEHSDRRASDQLIAGHLRLILSCDIKTYINEFQK